MANGFVIVNQLNEEEIHYPHSLIDKNNVNDLANRIDKTRGTVICLDDRFLEPYFHMLAIVLVTSHGSRGIIFISI